jgi:aryl-alcohol dehydrogenase-like predicted oxidoreductase
MEYTKLGRTGLDVSVIGIGTEHLRGQPRETVASTLRQAVGHGVNYFDIIFAMPGRGDLLGLCARQNVGVVAMKPFGGGKLLREFQNLKYPKNVV